MYKKMSAFVVFLVAFLNVNPVLGNLTCLSCIGIFQPRHCHSVAGCTNDEVCGVESVTLNGQILYNLGCRRREQCHSFSNGTSTQSHVSHPCAECCDHTLCNAAGCGQIGYPTVRGPMCYNCPLTDDHRKCHGITSCATDEECYIESKEEFSDMIYSSGCKLKQNCGTGDILSPIIGRRRRGERRDITGGHGGLPTCSNCCTGDLCNRQCGIQNPSACTPNPCLHGSCADDVNGYSCSCEPGYTGPDCQIDIDDCQSSPCVHGTCVDGINNYTCNCPSGFHGDICETDIDDCQSSPCVHGTCVDGINNYTCNCPSGFHGDICETDIDDCQSSPCVHGTCVDGINNYTCNCPSGFHGDLCETDIDDCQASPCVHGTCVDGINNYTCNCPSGFHGDICETDIDDCQSSPCVHGTCVDGINNYTCNCPSGFHGDICETDIDDCQSSPCVHGTCVDGINNYTCNCPSGFHGDLCETDIDDCQSSPCVHGTCVDGINNYTCNCPSGFHGDLCETDIDDCQASPCVHGTCVDGINKYICNCPSGFHGDLCETDIDDCQASPCVHGTCVDGINNYTCNCPSGFHGDLCETDFDDCQSSPCVSGTCVDGINNYICNCPSGVHGDLCETGSFRDCVSILKDNRNATSGVYRVQVSDNGQLQDVSVYCDMDTAGGGWTVFQKRYDGSVDFYRNFYQYENGFGDVHGEFWLGLKWLHLMTSKGHCDLRIDMVTDDGNPKYAHYTTFSVGIPTNYTLHIGNFDGNFRDAMSYHDGMPFTTFDHDRDRYSSNCAKYGLGGFWYNACYYANLNGVYVNSATGVKKINWYFDGIAMTELKLRCD